MAKRYILVKMNKAYSGGNFKVEQMPSLGRLDVAARSVLYGLWYSDGIRENTKVMLYFDSEPNPGLVLVFDGSKIKRISPNEREIGLFMQKALAHYEEKGEGELNNGIEIRRYKSFESFLRSLKPKISICYLMDKFGEHICKAKIKPTKDVLIVLGDNRGLKEEDIAAVNKTFKHSLELISIGDKEYLTTQTITIMHWFLDEGCRQ